jgi:ribosomal protein L34E
MNKKNVNAKSVINKNDKINIKYNNKINRMPRCIICGKEKEGLEVKEDFVIYAIRWFKRNITKNEKHYKLIVCKECYPKYYTAREKYEKRRALYLVLGIIFALLLVLIGQNKIIAVLYGIIIIIFVYLLSLFTYMPAVKIPEKLKKHIDTKSKST